jgi:two-component system NarL family response regulator
MRQGPVRVLVADDHRLMREGTAALLAGDPRIEVVALASDGLEAIERALETRPDVVLLDLDMPRVGGIQACSILRDRLPASQILILTVSEQQHDVYAALRVGAAGYLLKDIPVEELVEAILDLDRASPAISPAMAAKMLNELSDDGDISSDDARRASQLSEREREVLAHLSHGLTNREIAARLHVAESTVKTHVRHVLDKLHLRNRAEAAAFASRRSG